MNCKNKKNKIYKRNCFVFLQVLIFVAMFLFRSRHSEGQGRRRFVETSNHVLSFIGEFHSTLLLAPAWGTWYRAPQSKS